MINFIIISGSAIITLLSIGIIKEMTEVRSIKNSTSIEESIDNFNKMI